MSNSSFSSSCTLEDLKVTEDLKIKTEVAAKSGPCLLDCMELVLSDVDVFSAQKMSTHPGSSNRDGWAYHIQRDVSNNSSLCYFFISLA